MTGRTMSAQVDSLSSVHGIARHEVISHLQMISIKPEAVWEA